jgi:uncharacterized membrane protein (UPF0136 family)
MMEPGIMNITVAITLWIYIALLISGGVAGWLKAGSQASLFTSLISAIGVALSALRIAPLLVAQMIMGALAVFFFVRFTKTKKVMPALVMVIASAAALALTTIFSGRV